MRTSTSTSTYTYAFTCAHLQPHITSPRPPSAIVDSPVKWAGAAKNARKMKSKTITCLQTPHSTSVRTHTHTHTTYVPGVAPRTPHFPLHLHRLGLRLDVFVFICVACVRSFFAFFRKMLLRAACAACEAGAAKLCSAAYAQTRLPRFPSCCCSSCSCCSACPCLHVLVVVDVVVARARLA